MAKSIKSPGEEEKMENKKSESVVEEKIQQKAEEIEVQEIKAEKSDKKEITGIAYIFSSQNNTMVHITDLAGNTLSRITGGMVTKHSRLKSDPTIAMFVAKKAAERPKDLGVRSLYVRIRAKTGSESMGSGAHAAVKSLDKEGFKIISVLDATRIPRGGPKKKGGKRGRRV
ncbi:MAG: 30S ribosomal protein S11 [Nanoarchaeota archaeon]